MAAARSFYTYSGGIITFAEVGVPVATRTTAPPKLDEAAGAAVRAKALAGKYKTEFLQHG